MFDLQWHFCLSVTNRQDGWTDWPKFCESPRLQCEVFLLKLNLNIFCLLHLKSWLKYPSKTESKLRAQWAIRGGDGRSAKMSFYSINLLFKSNKVWPLPNYFLRKVSLRCKCYVYVKNFDQKPAISLNTLKIGFFNTHSTKSRIWGALEPLNLFYMYARIYLNI